MVIGVMFTNLAIVWAAPLCKHLLSIWIQTHGRTASAFPRPSAGKFRSSGLHVAPAPTFSPRGNENSRPVGTRDPLRIWKIHHGKLVKHREVTELTHKKTTRNWYGIMLVPD